MNEEAFQTRREDARGRLSLVAGEVSRLLTEIVAQAAPAALKLKRIENEALSADVAEQLKRLFPPSLFLLSAPLSQLMNYPRYLKAVLYRLEHYSSDPVGMLHGRQMSSVLRSLGTGGCCAPKAA